MLDEVRRDKSRAKARAAGSVAGSGAPAASQRADDLHPMVAVKLWQNPCWMSFRANWIAHHFNQPIYEWIARTYKLTAPEHVVLYALGLKQGITADDIVASSARPKNTLSRAVNRLLLRRLVTRVQDLDDRRRFRLYLTRQGKKIVADTVPLLVRQERAMIANLSAAEQKQLHQLLTRMVLGQQSWPTEITKED
jgi:MarR family transcriptional regulator, temperature-dependent positive regulator of motility